MKKLITLICLLLVLCACGVKSEEVVKEDNEIIKLINEGYEEHGCCYSENFFHGMFVKDNDYVYVDCGMSEEIYQEVSELDYADEEYETKWLDFLGSLEVKEVKSLNDLIPSEEDLKQYEGKTLGEIEELGFEQMGYAPESEGNSYYFFYENESIDCKVHVNELVEDIDNYSVNDLKELTIKEVVFSDLSSRLLDE